MSLSDQLCNLNQRLAGYIDMVRCQPVPPRPDSISVTESIMRDLSQIKETYEMELADARKTLDEVAKEKARLELELGKISKEHRELKIRNSKKESDLEAALDSLRDVEAQLISKNAALNKALGEKRTLEAELNDLKARLAELGIELTDTKRQLHNETLRRVDTENRLQTQKEQLEFQKAIHEKEKCVIQKKYESVIEELQCDKSKMSDTLAELKTQYEDQVRLDKEELERNYESKLEKAKQLAERNGDLYREARDELEQIQSRLDHVMGERSQLQTQLAASEARVEAMSRERSRMRQRLEEKEREIERKIQMQERLQREKQDAQREVNTYKRLLEGEEKRLHMTPGSTPQRSTYSPCLGEACGSRPCGSRPSGSRPSTSGSSKRQRLDFETPLMEGDAVAESRIRQYANASGRIVVDRVDLDGKFIRLRNMSDRDQSLSNWQVKRQVGTSTPIIYKFPFRFTLRAGGTVTIWASSGGGTHNPPTDLVWRGQNSWGTGNLLQTSLINASGEEMAMRKVARTLFQDDEDEEMGIRSTASMEREYNLRSRTVICDDGDDDGGDE